MDTELSIIVVNWNTRELLAQCLVSIYAQQTSAPCEVLVIDNASTDGSAAMVQARFPTARLHALDTNRGFAAATNYGIELSKGKYVLLLNPDTELHMGALRALLQFMEEEPIAGAAGAQLLDTNGSPQVSCYPLLSLFREGWRLFHLDRIYPVAEYPAAYWNTSQPRPVDTAQGACLILRRRAIDQVGVLDEDYFMYTEEVDLCYRLKQRGWTIWWVPEAQVLHYGGQSTRQVRVEMFLHLYSSKVHFFRKHQGKSAARTYKIILAAAAVGRIAPSLVYATLTRRRTGPWVDKLRLYRRLLTSLPTM